MGKINKPILSERLKKSINDYPDFPKKGIIFKDISPIISDPELFSDLTDKISKYPFFKETDAVIEIDARGFIFGSVIAKIAGKPLILARKKNKLPGKLIEANYGLEYGNDALSIQYSAIDRYKKFVIVDDLLATGGTARCVSEMLSKKDKIILALSVIIELTALNGKDNLNIPVYSEVKY